jgi:thioredoxin 1
MQHIKDTNFETEVLRSALPALVVFHAEWSPTSELAVQVIADLKENFGDLVSVHGMDVYANAMTPCQYAVEAVPAFFLFREGRVIKKLGPGFTRSELQGLFELAIADT